MILDEVRRTLLASLRSSDAAHLHGRRWFYVRTHGVFLNPDERKYGWVSVFRAIQESRTSHSLSSVWTVSVSTGRVLYGHTQKPMHRISKKKASRQDRHR